MYKSHLARTSYTNGPQLYPREFFKIMPLQVDSGNSEYSLNGFLHFLDVLFGETEVSRGGGSWWDLEFLIVETLGLRLINTGVSQPDHHQDTGTINDIEDVRQDANKPGKISTSNATSPHRPKPQPPCRYPDPIGLRSSLARYWLSRRREKSRGNP